MALADTIIIDETKNLLLENKPTVEIFDFTVEGYDVDYNEKEDMYYFTLIDESLMDTPTAIDDEALEPQIVGEGLCEEQSEDESSEPLQENDVPQAFASTIDLKLINLAPAAALVAYQKCAFNFRIQMSGSGTVYNLKLGVNFDGKKWTI